MEACEQRCHLLAQHVLAPEIALAEAEATCYDKRTVAVG